MWNSFEGRVCAVLASIHLITVAVCTYIAAIEIESIIVTGWICAATGLASGIAAFMAKKKSLAFALFLTPILAIILFVLEAFFLHLGPQRAALPFCIVFIVNQFSTVVATLVEMNRDLWHKSQVSIGALLSCTFFCALFSALVRFLLERKHNAMMIVALGMAGLTLVGLALSIYNVIVSSRANRHRKLAD
ncbi:MAG: hypothetical protein ABL921_02295 [Pirellula sp.]